MLIMRLVPALAIILLLAGTAAATAQGTDSAGSGPAAAATAGEATPVLDQQQALRRIQELETALRNAVTHIRSQEATPRTPPDVAQSYYAALKWDYEYAIRMREHTDWLFWWQLISVYALLGVTLLIVFFGVYVSVRELGHAMRASTVAAQRTKSVQDNPEATESSAEEPAPSRHIFKLSPGEVSITTTLTGIVILVLALGYLYLFVNQVMEFKPPMGTTPPKVTVSGE